MSQPFANRPNAVYDCNFVNQFRFDLQTAGIDTNKIATQIEELASRGESASVDEIDIDTYQRHSAQFRGDTKATIMKWLRVDGFKPAAYGHIVLAHRNGEKKLALDAAHRLLLAIVCGAQRVPVALHWTDSKADEAELYRIINGSRTKVAAADMHRANVIEGDPRAVALETALGFANVRIQKGGGKGTTINVASLMEAMDKYGAQAVSEGLIGYRAIYPDDRINGDVAAAFIAFYSIYGEKALKWLGAPPAHSTNGVPRLKKKYGKSLDILEQARKVSNRSGIERIQEVTRILTVEHNHDRSAAHRIDGTLFFQYIK